jgi:hypothetical protein
MARRIIICSGGFGFNFWRACEDPLETIFGVESLVVARDLEKREVLIE